MLAHKPDDIEFIFRQQVDAKWILWYQVGHFARDVVIGSNLHICADRCADDCFYVHTVRVSPIVGATIAKNQTCLFRAIHVAMVAPDGRADTFTRGDRYADVVAPTVAPPGRRNDHPV